MQRQHRAAFPALLTAFLLAAPRPAGAVPIPATFTAHSDHRTVAISYADWSTILDATVYDAGRSDRAVPAPPKPDIGRRFVLGNTSSLRLEGNRLYLPTFRGKNLKTLEHIKAELEAVPGAVAMKDWTRPQQLAYWLNLYNITMVDMLARHYPERDIHTLLYGKHGKGGLLDQKLLTVAGVKLSLNDIQYRILMPVWHDPLVMYGLFKGYVGAPNIRKAAFTADNVYDELRDNAAEFINSNRGARVYRGRLTVSEFYREIAPLFPNFEADLKAHLARYADPDLKATLQSASQVEATTHDYYVADLMQGVAADHNPNIANEGFIAGLDGTTQAMIDPVIAPPENGRWPTLVVRYAMKIQQRKAMHEGHVDVEEVEDKAPTGKADPQKGGN